MPRLKRKAEVVVLQRGRNHDPEYIAVNPLGTVPALVTPDGRLVVESLACAGLVPT